MDEKDHLRFLLDNGVDEWNAWRAAERAVVPNLVQADLRGANLSGADLAHARLTEAMLRGATLTGVDLAEADLMGATPAPRIGPTRRFAAGR